jgi:septal ring factor EnvC (AmiA/AmiB activator)
MAEAADIYKKMTSEMNTMKNDIARLKKTVTALEKDAATLHQVLSYMEVHAEKLQKSIDQVASARSPMRLPEPLYVVIHGDDPLEPPEFE